jgi:hypothetical protein
VLDDSTGANDTALLLTIIQGVNDKYDVITESLLIHTTERTTAGENLYERLLTNLK